MTEDITPGVRFNRYLVEGRSMIPPLKTELLSSICLGKDPPTLIAIEIPGYGYDEVETSRLLAFYLLCRRSGIMHHYIQETPNAE